MKVSIIISSYNEKEYLIEAIESCLSQDYQKDFEIVISDDGSTDGSIEIIKKYIESYPDKVKGVFDKRDDGVGYKEFRMSNCRARGIAIASGDYLIILDGDDLISSDKLRLQAGFLDKNKKYVACYSDFEWFWHEEKRQITFYNYSEVNRRLLFSRIYIHLSCFMFRKSVIPNFVKNHVNDNMAVRSILASGKVCHLSGVTFKYRQRSDSIWNSYDMFEKNIVSVIALQAVLENRMLFLSSISRYHLSLKTLYNSRKELSDMKYRYYFNFIGHYSNHILVCLRDYNKLFWTKKISLHILLFSSKVCRFYFSNVKRVFERMNHKRICEYKMIEK